MRFVRHDIILITVLVIIATGGLAQAEAYMQGQVVPDPRNPRWLCRYDTAGNHQPFMLVGPADPEALLYFDNAEELVKKMAKHGGNSIYVLADASGDNDPDFKPYIGGKASNGADPAILDRWRKLFDICEENGIVVVFFFYDDGVNPWGTTSTVTDGEYRLMKQYVEKFSDLKNLIWYFAEEYEEAGNIERAADWARTMKELDPHDHIIGISTRGNMGWELQNNDDVDQWGSQCNKLADDDWHACAVNGWSELGPGQHLNMLENTERVRGDLVRKRLWAGAMGGGACNMDLWNRIDNATVGELNDMRNLQKFFESTDLYNMAPNDGLAAAETNYVLAKPGVSYIAYARELNSEMGIRNMNAGEYDFHWYDIAANKSVRQSKVSTYAGIRKWKKPGGFGKEVALHVVRSGSSAVNAPPAASP